MQQRTRRYADRVAALEILEQQRQAEPAADVRTLAEALDIAAAAALADPAVIWRYPLGERIGSWGVAVTSVRTDPAYQAEVAAMVTDRLHRPVSWPMLERACAIVNGAGVGDRHDLARRALAAGSNNYYVHRHCAGLELAALGYHYGYGSYQTCACCQWRTPRVTRLGEPYARAQPCPVCGACYAPGMGGPATYACPRCAHSYTGRTGDATPCPRCAYAPPPPIFTTSSDDEAEREVYYAAVVMGLARRYDAHMALRWYAPGGHEGVELIDALRTWWYHDMPAHTLELAHDGIQAGDLRVTATRRDGQPCTTMVATDDRELDPFALYLGRLLQGWQQIHDRPPVATSTEALAALESMRALGEQAARC